ncbi:formimidoylglutamase [compost metagenome]
MQIILAPTNLGLRPLWPGHIPGTWRAPQALMAQGLTQRLAAEAIHELVSPTYSPLAPSGTRIRNGHAIRAFNLELAAEVAAVQARGDFPLVHIDGHSDFRHPGNYDPQQMLGAVAGMDLALATGRGEALLTEWPDVAGPLVPDRQVLQLGERECRDVDFAWPDINQTAITRIDVFAANLMGRAEIIRHIDQMLAAEPEWRFWLHLDVDVLDQTVMPAVDSPGSPGIDRLWLENIGAKLLQNPLCCGMTVSVFDPDLDPDGRYAALIVEMLAAMFHRHKP